MTIDSLFPRSDYPTLNEAVYLNQASLGLVGQPAFKAMQAFLETVGRHGNLNMSDEDEVAYFANLRHSAAQLLHCRPNQVAILGGASELLGQLPYLLAPQYGRKIVALASDFPALTRPWLHYSSRFDCPIQFVDDLPNQSLTDTLIEALDENTAVLIISHVQFATGSKVDVVRLREASRAMKATLIVDVTQAAGAIPVDTLAWQADVVVTSGYKWLGGHGGVALGVLSDALLEKTPPLPGWMSAPNPFHFEATTLKFASDARRYTQSTMSYSSLAGLTVAIDQLLAVGVSNIANHAKRLANQLIQGVIPLGWRPFHKWDNRDGAHHIVSLAHPNIKAEKAAKALRTAGVICGARNGRVRVSIAPYNDGKDIQLFIQKLGEVTR